MLKSKIKNCPTTKHFGRRCQVSKTHTCFRFSVFRFFSFSVCIFYFWFFIFSFRAESKVYLRDVPEGHYAYEAVYELIKLGVISGFPDGTFQGKKLVTRYELSSFLSKFVKSLAVEKGKKEKLLAELRSEISLAQQQIKEETVVSGKLLLRWWKGEEKVADYRITGYLEKNLTEAASIRLAFDSLDSGFGGPGREFVSELLEAEGKIKGSDWVLKITSGPGDVACTGETFLPAEKGMIFRKLKRTISFSKTCGKTNFSLEHLVRSASETGQVSVGEISGKLAHDFLKFKLEINPRIFYNQSGERDLRLDLFAKLPLLKFLLGIAKFTNFPRGLYAKGELEIVGGLKVIAQKIGSEFRENFSYGIFDIFDRKLSDSSSSFGLEGAYDLSGNFIFKIRSDYTLPAEAQTWELKLEEKNKIFGIFYQLYKTSGTWQAAGLLAKVEF